MPCDSTHLNVTTSVCSARIVENGVWSWYHCFLCLHSFTSFTDKRWKTGRSLGKFLAQSWDEKRGQYGAQFLSSKFLNVKIRDQTSKSNCCVEELTPQIYTNLKGCACHIFFFTIFKALTIRVSRYEVNMFKCSIDFTIHNCNLIQSFYLFKFLYF